MAAYEVQEGAAQKTVFIIMYKLRTEVDEKAGSEARHQHFGC
jgi:hypothetical protein